MAALIAVIVYFQFFLYKKYDHYSVGEALAAARASVASLIGAKPSEVFFTSCGTESDNWAVWGAVGSRRRRPNSSSWEAALPHLFQSETLGGTTSNQGICGGHLTKHIGPVLAGLRLMMLWVWVA